MLVQWFKDSACKERWNDTEVEADKPRGTGTLVYYVGNEHSESTIVILDSEGNFEEKPISVVQQIIKGTAEEKDGVWQAKMRLENKTLTDELRELTAHNERLATELKASDAELGVLKAVAATDKPKVKIVKPKKE